MSLFTDLKEVLTPYAQRIKGLAAADEQIKADLGSLMEPKRLADGTDLNTVATPGTYTLHANATYINKPTSDAEHGILEVWHEDFNTNQGRTFQRLTYTYKAGRTCTEIWARTKAATSGATWTPWKSVVNVEDIFNDAIKEALLNCFNHIGWEDENGKQYRDALELALYPNNVVSISAMLTLGNHIVYTTDNINSLRNFLHVEATKSDGSKKEIKDYTLNGDISSAGSHVVTINYNRLTTSFTVTSSTNNVGILYEWDFTKGLNDLRQNKTAVLGTGERVDYPDYTGSFVLGAGTTPPILTANGLSFNNEQQWCRLFDRNFNSSEYLADKTIQVDVASFSYAHGSECHTRFITFADPAAKSNTDGGKLARFQDGLIFRNGKGWSYYDGHAWNDNIFGNMTNRSDISGHTVALVLNNFTYPKVYVDGVYKGTGNKNHNDIMYGLQIGDGGVASDGGTFYNALITGVRIYSGEVVN